MNVELDVTEQLLII